MPRLFLALLAVAAFAGPAPAPSIPLSGPRMVLSPDGRLALLHVGSFGGGRDPDARGALGQDLPAGLYRRGEWAAPLWHFPREASGSESFHVADDGVHLVAVPFHGSIGNLRYKGPFPREFYNHFRSAPAFRVFARGRLVRAVAVHEVTRDPDRLMEDNAHWLDRLELDEAAGLVRVTARDGNRTAFALATGVRVEGTGAWAYRTGPPEWVLAGALGVIGAVAGGVWVARLRRRPPARFSGASDLHD